MHTGRAQGLEDEEIGHWIINPVGFWKLFTVNGILFVFLDEAESRIL